MQTIAELFTSPLSNSYRPCTSQHVASLESLIAVLTLQMLNYNLTISNNPCGYKCTNTARSPADHQAHVTSLL